VPLLFPTRPLIITSRQRESSNQETGCGVMPQDHRWRRARVRFVSEQVPCSTFSSIEKRYQESVRQPFLMANSRREYNARVRTCGQTRRSHCGVPRIVPNSGLDRRQAARAAPAELPLPKNSSINQRAENSSPARRMRLASGPISENRLAPSQRAFGLRNVRLQTPKDTAC